DELLSLMQMPNLRKQRADQLSGGEKQRLSLACALLHDPELLLLDEPTIGLDPALRSEFWEHFRALKQRGRTILLTTHYLEEAEHCDRVGMMKLGRLVANDTPAKLKECVSTKDESVSMEQVFLRLTQASKSERSDA
ncbi:MAG: AAA family ATPase, partial [Candidatus Bipolaricaulota bacterium]|nr:AAA family ATPase [Candidatus Bipolaricaulota bacterium]